MALCDRGYRNVEKYLAASKRQDTREDTEDDTDDDLETFLATVEEELFVRDALPAEYECFCGKVFRGKNRIRDGGLADHFSDFCSFFSDWRKAVMKLEPVEGR